MLFSSACEHAGLKRLNDLAQGRRGQAGDVTLPVADLGVRGHEQPTVLALGPIRGAQ